VASTAGAAGAAVLASTAGAAGAAGAGDAAFGVFIKNSLVNHYTYNPIRIVLRMKKGRI
jgi:hypothetical protein